ncbi:hypothetical protein RJ639_043959 [Escallonia herrerae]|uniref:Uncharacterized protein n=1 Tax=Escallonia herrerae TaxID=1293975 RepID=A0AA88WF25_9ASTE|nr:hypothetical protein RJ639_043959 [Escallonia herrerae]
MRIYRNRDLLGKVSRNSKMISEYLLEIHSLADKLASVGSPISNAKLVVKILNGLGPEFHEISVTILARDTPISYEKLFDKLLYHEHFLKHKELKKHQTPIMVQVAQRTGSNNSNNFSNQRWHPQQSQQQNSNMPSQFFTAIFNANSYSRSLAGQPEYFTSSLAFKYLKSKHIGFHLVCIFQLFNS